MSETKEYTQHLGHGYVIDLHLFASRPVILKHKGKQIRTFKVYDNAVKVAKICMKDDQQDQ